jgi:hypothetical protein
MPNYNFGLQKPPKSTFKKQQGTNLTGESLARFEYFRDYIFINGQIEMPLTEIYNIIKEENEVKDAGEKKIMQLKHNLDLSEMTRYQPLMKGVDREKFYVKYDVVLDKINVEATKALDKAENEKRAAERKEMKTAAAAENRTGTVPTENEPESENNSETTEIVNITREFYEKQAAAAAQQRSITNLQSPSEAPPQPPNKSSRRSSNTPPPLPSKRNQLFSVSAEAPPLPPRITKKNRPPPPTEAPPQRPNRQPPPLPPRPPPRKSLIPASQRYNPQTGQLNNLSYNSSNLRGGKSRLRKYKSKKQKRTRKNKKSRKSHKK